MLWRENATLSRHQEPSLLHLNYQQNDVRQQYSEYVEKRANLYARQSIRILVVSARSHLLSSTAFHDPPVIFYVNLERLQIAVVDAQHDLTALHVQLQHPLQLYKAIN